MTAPEFLQTIESSAFATWVRDSLYAFPIFESFHVIGLTLVFGTIAVMDFRMLGWASTKRPLSRVRADITMWTWLAFALTVVTGLIMFTTNATGYYGNFYFRIKMLSIALAGINMLAFESTAGRRIPLWDKNAAGPRAAKIAAVLSLAIWLAVIFFGRWIGFTKTPSTAAPEVEIDFENLFE